MDQMAVPVWPDEEIVGTAAARDEAVIGFIQYKGDPVPAGEAYETFIARTSCVPTSTPSTSTCMMGPMSPARLP